MADQRRRERKNAELDYLANSRSTALPEEFPEGPYGAALFPEDEPGKVTPWQPGQQAASRFKDENPVFSRGAAPPPGDEPPGPQL